MIEILQALDQGFTLLETILGLLNVTVTPALVVLWNSSRKTTKEIIKSIEENPEVDNDSILKHATKTLKKRAIKRLSKGLNGG